MTYIKSKLTVGLCLALFLTLPVHSKTVSFSPFKTKGKMTAKAQKINTGIQSALKGFGHSIVPGKGGEIQLTGTAFDSGEKAILVAKMANKKGKVLGETVTGSLSQIDKLIQDLAKKINSALGKL